MTTDHLAAMSGRRPSLTALDEATRKRGGMSCGIVSRGGTPVLYVISTESPSRYTEIGADFAETARLLLLFGTVCLLFGAMAGYVLGPGLVHRTRRLLRRLRR